MFSTWDLVRPTLWHPMSMLELSMMDVNSLPQLSMSMRDVPGVSTDEEFFKDLPAEEQQQQQQQQKEKEEETPETENQRAFSSYSFSSSSVVDGQGRKVTSTRRRYEDSTGRLKAEHEREVLGKRLKTVWNRKNPKDEGEHQTMCSQGTADEFEKLWSQTTFGKAQEKKRKELKKSGEATPGGQQQQKQVESEPKPMAE
ncbi:hypothetical protein PHYPSEUDO_005658 [Phytophthora pseudosyringae]|uniref:Uncharacterized protein n=1 Tax=Phytophthora pseudosyringae TaxID=221518 RepID=A0A8T1VLH5_9STRA|nr:hypothetical protein PHYPSEUDO_005658 [Phytophthora pseudosyringae]